MKFAIKNRWSGDVQFEAEIECADDARQSVKLGLAVRVAFKSGANLSGADLSRANLSGADLSRANLYGANLSGADLPDDPAGQLAIARTRILPEGDLIGWKSCQDGVLIRLRVPAAAKRCHAFGRKCRAEYVEVLEVFGAAEGVTIQHGPETVYRVGETVRPDSFDEDWRNECSNGIHFFITRAEAEVMGMTTLQSALAEIREHFENRMDVNWEGDGPTKKQTTLNTLAGGLSMVRAALNGTPLPGYRHHGV